MNILVAAITCNPVWGSEATFGWNAVSALARQHQIWVLLSEPNRQPFDEWLKTHTLPENIHLHFIGKNTPHHPNRMIARIESWIRNYQWHRKLLEPARLLQGKVHFDLIHHVTYSTWRVASPLWRTGIPFIWGPLGGGELFPWRAVGILSPMTLIFEMVRAVSNFVSRHDPAIRNCARNAAACIAANKESFDMLSLVRGTERGISKLSSSFFRKEKIEVFEKLLPVKTSGGTLRLFAGGNLEGRKGVAIALHALANARKNGVAFSYRLGGFGPEFHHLQKLSQTLGIAGDVILGDYLRGDAYRDELIKSHIYLLPSLRENAGITLMEAMLAGCVPIVADCGGPGEIVTDECGFRIPVSTPRQMSEAIAQILIRLNENRGLLEALGKAAHRRIATEYCEEKYLEKINAIYREVLKR